MTVLKGVLGIPFSLKSANPADCREFATLDLTAAPTILRHVIVIFLTRMTYYSNLCSVRYYMAVGPTMGLSEMSIPRMQIPSC